MNELEAREALRPHLVFGSDRQIQAIRFLDAVAETVDQILGGPECESCNGYGELEECCDECEDGSCGGCRDGLVVVECEFCHELGHFFIPEPDTKYDVLIAAIAAIKRERRHP